MDFAKRAYDHGFPFDPIIRSLLDTDFYKLLMMQLIWKKYRNVNVAFAVTNRTRSVKLATELGISGDGFTVSGAEELRQQLDHVKSLRFQPNELIWLAGQTFYGQTGIFEPDFIAFLRDEFFLSDYALNVEVDAKQPTGGWFDPPTGQLVLETSGPWVASTMWEIYLLPIINELRYRRHMRVMSRSELDIMYARAKVKLYAKLERLKTIPKLNLTDFGTRRRHSHLWQEHAILTAKEVLGNCFTGTSNCFFAMKHGLDAKGTNAHELPMVLTALADTPEEKKNAQYAVLRDWEEMYDGALRVFLPDTFGTTQFLADAPEWVKLWKGARPDSKKPIPGGEELIDYWGKEAPNKLIIFSDGLDVALSGYEPQGEDILTIWDHFAGRVGMGFGWGTNLTNDFIGCHPLNPNAMKPISLVCKVKSANGRPAVKLSDNYSKATGPVEEVTRYRAIFGTEGLENVPVKV
jgi:nicotinate phosphoribosyltransferase